VGSAVAVANAAEMQLAEALDLLAVAHIEAEDTGAVGSETYQSLDEVMKSHHLDEVGNVYPCLKRCLRSTRRLLAKAVLHTVSVVRLKDLVGTALGVIQNDGFHTCQNCTCGCW